MENEELYTSLSYLEYQRFSSRRGGAETKLSDCLDIYQRNDRINFRIKDKTDITKALVDASTSSEKKEDFLRSIKSVESFIKKVKLILIDSDAEEENKFLDAELSELFHTRNQYKRTWQSFYSLWYIVADLTPEMIKVNRIKIKKEIKEIFGFTKSVPARLNSDECLEIFKHKVYDFKTK